jgi:preprotein translocase subunit SecA
LVEFKNEAYELFESLIDRIDGELARRIFRVGVTRPRPEIPIEQARTNIDTTDAMGLAQADGDETAKSGEPAFAKASTDAKAMADVSADRPVSETTGQVRKKKVGRNDPCPCGSGKKYKKCHYPEYG